MVHWYVCPECGAGVAADEDGCCAGCGEKCTHGVSTVQALVRERDAARAEVERLRGEVDAMTSFSAMHLKAIDAAVAKAREEQREACATAAASGKYALTGGPNSLSGAFNSGRDDASTAVRATPLTATPLADRIRELESEVERLKKHPCRDGGGSGCAAETPMDPPCAACRVKGDFDQTWEQLRLVIGVLQKRATIDPTNENDRACDAVRRTADERDDALSRLVRVTAAGQEMCDRLADRGDDDARSAWDAAVKP